MPGKTVMLLKWSKFALKLAAAAAIGLALQSTASFAADAAPVERVLQWVIDTLGGNIARSFAIIAVSFLGFMAMTGRLSWQLAGSIVIGIALVFGAAKLVDAIKDTAGA